MLSDIQHERLASILAINAHPAKKVKFAFSVFCITKYVL